MTEQMNYATYGRSRRRRIRPADRRSQQLRSSGNLRGSMQKQKSEPNSNPSASAAPVRRRKYTQTTNRSPSPPPRSNRNRSVSPPRRKSSGRQRTPERVRSRSQSDRRPKLVKSKSLDARPRQHYQKKQNQFHSQMSGFDFFEKKPEKAEVVKRKHDDDDDDDAKPTNGTKFVKSAKSFLKDKLPAVGVPTISGNTCKKYSEIMMSKFRSDGSAISYYSGSGSASDGSVDVTCTKLSCDDCSSDGSDSAVEREEVDMYEQDYNDVSERSHELESGLGSNEDTKISSLTFSQHYHQSDETTAEDSDYEDDNPKDNQINKFTKELVILLDENESLRGNINGLRLDFESMMKQMKMIADEDEATDDEQSIQTDDNSRVSHCLRKIDEMKIQALEKFKKVTEKHQGEKNAELAKKEKDIESFEACIEDLLCENERLYKDVITLSKEREDILNELKGLRHEVGGKQVDFVSSSESVAASVGTIPHFMLTDEKEAKSQNTCLDNIALLLKKMKMSSKENGNDMTETEDDIIALVSKIMSQQHHREHLEKVTEEMPVESDDNCSKDPSQTCKDSLDDEHPVAKDDAYISGADDDDYISGTDDEEYISGADDAEYISGEDDGDYISGEDDDDDYISGEDDDDFQSWSSSKCEESSIDNDRCPSYEVSADSLFDKKNHGFYPDKHQDDDASEALEVIYEYYSSSSEGSGSSGPARRYSPGLVQSKYNDYAEDYVSGSSASSSSPIRRYSPGMVGCVDYDDEDSEDSDYSDEHDYHPRRGSFYTSTTYSSFHSDIESAEYYMNSTDRSRSRSASRSRARSASASRSRASTSRSQARSVSTSRARSTSASRSRGDCNSTRRARSASRSRSCRGRGNTPESRGSPVSSRRSSLNDESILEEDENSENPAQEEEIIANAIDSHLEPSVFNKPLRVRTLSTCASISASESTSPTYPSFSSDSTKEQKAITITVVCRSSNHISFPSTREHTFVSFFTVSVRKSQVDAVLEEQLIEERKTLDSSRNSLNNSSATCPQNNCSKKKKKSKKYKGEFDDEGRRHGYGVYTSKNGNEYRGEWSKNKREGLGVVKVGNGDVFEGQFEGNLKNGIGVYHYHDGECDLSRYEDDVRVGESVRWSADRKKAFVLTEEPSVREVSLEEASSIAMKKMGTVVAY